ncbi:nuclear transport factor 2 family protein [Streptomyces parvulus]|uniref:Nuclear transport factor 2 family protein n=1 Tax=Streptomyces parvulus TaxID=146923 RepID=A0A369UWV4_9ACTN|nr:nuclear transport factor 2 family protein [Streptomyces parvulus]RDD85272.1 nuclear transport factor 2 family protein [Streptomyces parvulus]
MSQLKNEPDREEPPRGDPVRAVRAYYRFVDTGNIRELAQLFALDALYRRPGYREIFGRAELERFYREERVIAEGAHTLSKIISEDREVAVRGVFTGVLRDGTETSAEFADFFRVNAAGEFSLRQTFFFVPLV